MPFPGAASSAMNATAHRGTTAAALWTVLVVAVLIRAWSFASLPLIFTNDSTEYLAAATQIHDGSEVGLSVVRTPGYPVFLAGLFTLFGLDQNAILAGHHLLGILSAVLLAWAIAPLAGPRGAAAVGIMFSLDPFVLAFESYLLTETLALHLVVLSAALVIRGRGRGPLVGLLLGLLLGAAALTRPALQAIVPFFALGWLLMHGRGWSGRAGGAVVVAAGIALLLVPWTQFNRSRDVSGVASGFSSMQWYGFARFDLLDWDHPIDEEVRRAYRARYGDAQPGFYDLLDFMHEVGAWDERAAAFAAWNRASLRANFDRYLQVWGQALLWQLNVKVGRVQYDQLRWFVERLAEDGTSDQLSENRNLVHRPLNHVINRASGGSGRAFYRWLHKERIPGLPQVPLFVLAVLAVLLGCRRRQWGLVFVLLGTLAYLFAHVTLLLPQTRYCLPAWPVWYLAVAAVPVLLRGSGFDHQSVVGEGDAGG